MISNQKKILILLNQFKFTALTISKISERTNLDRSSVKQALIELKQLNYISSSSRTIEIKNCWFSITPLGVSKINSIR